jgi:hypothetical protein
VCRDMSAAKDDGFGFGSMDFDGCLEAYACEEHPRCEENAKVTVRSSHLAHTSRKKDKKVKARTLSLG